jgi:hypothetical protein
MKNILDLATCSDINPYEDPLINLVRDLKKKVKDLEENVEELKVK